MPHGFLNDGRRRGFQFERKLVEDKLVMKIHEEAGSVPNERIEIKSTDLIRHRATRECNHYILYRSVYNSCNSLVGQYDSSIHRSIYQEGKRRIESFASPVFHLTSSSVEFSREARNALNGKQIFVHGV